MKRCPTCNQTFEEGWLSFCTADGTTLIEDSSSRSEPLPTMVAPPPKVSKPNEQANWNTPSGGFGSPQFPVPQPAQPAWQPPPPPPSYAVAPQQGLAVASLICGIFTVTFGWCYVGIVTGPIAIVLGIIALVQIKNKPERHTGRPMAITGIVTGAVYFVIIAIIILIAIIMQGVK